MSSLASALSTVASSLDSLLPRPESLRQQVTGDSDFTEPLTLIFELVLPGNSLGTASSSYLFPLQLAPQAYGISEPFSVEVTPTQNGGLYVEEGGIVQRRIRLRGTTGFWPAPLPIQPPITRTPPAGSSYSRQLPPMVATNILSGQRHFQWLQDSVLRTYGDYKRDPTTSAETRLYLHDPQNGEDWLVCPMAFSSERSSQSPLEYPYDIDLLVLDKDVELDIISPSSDRSLLQAMGDTLRATQGFLRRATAAVNDLTAVQNQLSLAVHGVGAVVGQASTLVGAVANFVAGTSELVQSPYQAIFSVAQGCENALRIAANLRGLGLTLANWPRPIEQRFHALTTAAEQLGLAPNAFIPTAGTLRTQQAIVAAPTTTPATLQSFAAIQGQGSQGMPSDSTLAASKTQQTARISDYPYTIAYTVQSGDSLTSLAVRFLRDARLWSVLAAANDMSPPVLPSAPAKSKGPAFFGSLLRVGQTLRIPTIAAPVAATQNAAVLGARPEQPPETQSLGVDIQTVIDARGQRDWALGSTDGLPDIGTIEGEANFEQAMTARLMVERGTAILYPNLGLPLLIGTAQASADWQQVRLRVQQSLGADPRVRQVQNVEMTSLGDGVALNVTLQRVDSSGAAQLTLAV